MAEFPTLDDAHTVIPDVIRSHATYFPEKEAVVCGSVRRSWKDFGRNVDRVGNALHGAGVRLGDRIAILMSNSIEMLEATFGVIACGACAVPLSGLLTGDQLATLIDDSGAVGIFATADFRARLGDRLLALRCVRPDLRIAVLSPQAGWRDYDELVGGAPCTPPPVKIGPADNFNIIYSSGTTGLPKGIVQTHRARLHFAFSHALEQGFSRDSRTLTTTALCSNGTWMVMLPCLFLGGTLVVMPSFDPALFLDLLERERITNTFLVPPQYMWVLQRPDIETRDLASLKVLLCAGSPLRRDTKKEVLRRFGDKLIELYGFSEGFATMLKPGQHAAKFETVGTPVLGFEIKIIGVDGRELPRGEIGEIAGYGAGMMSGYHDRPEQTAALIWRDERGRTFMRSGDIGVLDEDGFLKIVDRKKDMIISGGLNVFPIDIEKVVSQHPAVQDVAVIGVPSERWGESALALVVPRPEAHATPSDIAEWANARLAKHQRLVGVEFRDEFPRNVLGKVLKRELRRPYWSSGGEKTP